jgi:hypothetical protein
MENISHIFYINLEHRLDRLEHITKQLELIGATDKAERFLGIRTTNGAIGCTISHIKCLELAAQRNYENVFICEDDITFLDVPVFLDGLTKFFGVGGARAVGWDVLVVGGNNGPPFQRVNNYCMRIHNCQSTTGYIVNRKYYEILIRNFKEGLGLLMKEPENKSLYAIDMYWKRLQVVHQWYLIIPVTVVQIESYSDVENMVMDYKALMLDYDKRLYLEYLRKKNREKDG